MARAHATTTIRGTGQVSIGELIVGAGNYWPRSYTDAEGHEHTGPTAMLWLMVEEHPEEHERVVAFPGLVFQKGDQRLRVDAVTDDSVTLTSL